MIECKIIGYKINVTFFLQDFQKNIYIENGVLNWFVVQWHLLWGHYNSWFYNDNFDLRVNKSFGHLDH